MRNSDFRLVSQVTLKPMQHVVFSDGHHASLSYELRAVNGGAADVLLVSQFDARSFGGGVTEERQIVEVKPYRDGRGRRACPKRAARAEAIAPAIAHERALAAAAAANWRAASKHAQVCLSAEPDHSGCAEVLERVRAECRNVYLRGYGLVGSRPDEAAKAFREVMATCPALDESYERAKIRLDDMKR